MYPLVGVSVHTVVFYLLEMNLIKAKILGCQCLYFDQINFLLNRKLQCGHPSPIRERLTVTPDKRGRGYSDRHCSFQVCRKNSVFILVMEMNIQWKVPLPNASHYFFLFGRWVVTSVPSLPPLVAALNQLPRVKWIFSVPLD